MAEEVPRDDPGVDEQSLLEGGWERGWFRPSRQQAERLNMDEPDIQDDLVGRILELGFSQQVLWRV